MVKQDDEYWVPEVVRAYLRAQGYSTGALEDMEPHIRNGIFWMRAVGECPCQAECPRERVLPGAFCLTRTGWPERRVLPSGSGRGVLARHRIKKTRQCACSEAEVRRVLLVTVYCICRTIGWL